MRFLFLMLIALSIAPTSIAQTGRCLGDRPGILDIDGFEVRFDSWVEKVANSIRKVEFGRCISTNSKQYFNAEWWPIGLSGGVDANTQLRVVQSFLSDEVIDIPSNIYITRDQRYVGTVQSSVTASALERLRASPQNKNIPSADWRVELENLLGKAIRYQLSDEELSEISTLETEAIITFQHPDLPAPSTLKFNVVSRLPGLDSGILYSRDVTFLAQLIDQTDPTAFAAALEASAVELKPHSYYMVDYLFRRDESILLSEAFSKDGVRHDFYNMPEDQLTIEQVKLDVVVDRSTVASFPILIFSSREFIIE